MFGHLRHPPIKTSLFFVVILFTLLQSCHSQSGIKSFQGSAEDNAFTELSIDLLESIKKQKDPQPILDQLAEIDPKQLSSALSHDTQKKAFWINIYNAHIQWLLQNDSSLFENRTAFFAQKRIQIAQQELSFDDIEHGIIRGSEFKLALGLIKNPFAGKFEKQFRVQKTDGRIHFALNCGAKSCPQIASYRAQNFNQTLNQVAKSFLKQSSQCHEKESRVEVSALFSWFRGDFGGKKGSLDYLKFYQIIPEDSSPAINYQDYDWTLSLGNYYTPSNE